MSDGVKIISLLWSGRTWPFKCVNAPRWKLLAINSSYSVRGFALAISDPGFPDTTSNVLAWSGRTRLLFGVKDSYF